MSKTDFAIAFYVKNWVRCAADCLVQIFFAPFSAISGFWSQIQTVCSHDFRRRPSENWGVFRLAGGTKFMGKTDFAIAFCVKNWARCAADYLVQICFAPFSAISDFWSKM